MAPALFSASFLLLSGPLPANAATAEYLPFANLSSSWGVVVIALLLLAAYFVLLFLLSGVRSSVPKKPETPPEAVTDFSFSPAEAGYLFRLEYDDSCIVASLIHLAHQGILSISDHHLGWMIHRESPCPGTVAPEERFLYQNLFRKKPSMLLEYKGGRVFSQVRRNFARFLNNRYGRRLSKPRMDVFLPGAVLAVLGGIALAATPGKTLVHIATYAGGAAVILLAGAFIVTRPTSYASQGNLEAEALRHHLTAVEIPGQSVEKTLLHFYAHLPHAVALDAARWWIVRNSETLHSLGEDPAEVETPWYTDGRTGLPGLVNLIENLVKTFHQMA
ncbi:MAG: hypothetical protein Kow0047_26980 [Anaerolineae bacterium]